MELPITDNTGSNDPYPTDAQLVAATLGGDRQALGHIYDRYSDRIYTMCVHMLGDRDEAADVCSEVFVVAFGRLDQLRDPARLRPWMYAICRHEVFRRTKRRGRVRLVDEVSEMDRAAEYHDLDAVDAEANQAGLALVVREAAAGLDDRDRLVLELQLQGVEGDDLAAALGTSTSTSYQHLHRMRERLERSIGALLVARQGRSDCDELDRLLSSWDGRFSVLWRKRVARHVDGCDICEHRRAGVPAALFGTAGASPLLVTPTSVRDRVLSTAVVGGGPGGLGPRRWRGDGFPPHPDRARRPGGFAVAAVVVLVLVIAGLWTLPADDATTVATSDRTRSIPTSLTSTTAAPRVTTSAPFPSSTIPLVVETAASTTTAQRPTSTRVVAPPTTVPLASTSTTSVPTTTTSAPASTTTTTAAPPTLRLSGPSALSARAAGGGACANTAFAATITSGGIPTSVTLRWIAGTTSGTVAMVRNRTRNGWNGTIDLPYGSTGAVTIVAEATSGGATGRSNTLTATVNPCPVIE